MEEVGIEEPFDDWSGFMRGHLYEAALRLLGALGGDRGFPDDVEGIERLLGRVAEGEPGEVMRFAAEAPDELPRYSGRHLVWVAPAGDSGLRLRAEGAGLEAVSVTFGADGRLGEFTVHEGFGVPDAELTECARTDRDRVERLLREQEVADAQSHRMGEEEQRRFRTEHLLEVRVAPPQDPGGLVVTWLGLYDTGVIVNYLVPRPVEEEVDWDDNGETDLFDAAHPSIALSDSEGTLYEAVGSGDEDVTGPLLRANREFTPAVPAGVSHLVVRTEWGSVAVEVGPR